MIVEAWECARGREGRFQPTHRESARRENAEDTPDVACQENSSSVARNERANWQREGAYTARDQLFFLIPYADVAASANQRDPHVEQLRGKSNQPSTRRTTALVSFRWAGDKDQGSRGDLNRLKK